MLRQRRWRPPVDFGFALVIGLLALAGALAPAAPASHWAPARAELGALPEQASTESTTTTTAPPPTTTTTRAPAPPPSAAFVSSAACVPQGTYAEDALTTSTADWACIRLAEGAYGDWSGAYGILESTARSYGWPWPMGGVSPATQDGYALRLFAANGDRFSGTWNNRYTASEGGPLR